MYIAGTFPIGKTDRISHRAFKGQEWDEIPSLVGNVGKEIKVGGNISYLKPRDKSDKYVVCIDGIAYLLADADKEEIKISDAELISRRDIWVEFEVTEVIGLVEERHGKYYLWSSSVELFSEQKYSNLWKQGDYLFLADKSNNIYVRTLTL